MNKLFSRIRTGFKISLILILVAAGSTPAAKYSGEFLELGVSARALGMGGAYTAIATDASAPFYNPAGLYAVKSKSVSFMHTENFGDLVNHDFIGGTIPVNGREAGLGVALMRLGGGDIKLTEKSTRYAGIDNPYDGQGVTYAVSRIGKHADYTGLASYGTRWRQNSAVGVTAKVIYRRLADETAFGLGFDLGMMSQLTQNLSVAAVLKDASATFLAYSTGTTESIYPHLNLGTAYSVVRSNFVFLVVADAAIKFEHRDETAQVSLGGTSSDFLVGGELTFKDRVSGRVGTHKGDLTAGAGIKLGRFSVDLAYLSHAELDNSYRLNLGGYF